MFHIIINMNQDAGDTAKAPSDTSSQPSNSQYQVYGNQHGNARGI